MANALLLAKTVDTNRILGSVQDGLELTWQAALAKDVHYTLFRYEDLTAWVTFSTVFIALLFFDNAVLHRNPQALSVARAAAYTLFWVACAGCFCCWVYWWYGANHAFMWMSGYMLEWMLSFDNLFVFHLIFSVYATPDHLKHRPLYFGICGAVFFRLAFIFVGECLMRAMFLMHVVFGAFLIYSGVKTATTQEDDEDPSRSPVMHWLQQQVPFVSAYDERGAFFVRVPLNDRGEAVLPSSSDCRPSESDALKGADTAASKARYGTVDFAVTATKLQELGHRGCRRGQWRATMLFVVVCCLELSDILFAVDSVSAIVAQVSDLFLAYTSVVFAMLGLRATFFIIDELVRVFSLLRYGVAAVLVFIGVKLILARFVHVPPSAVCVVLVGCIATSMAASALQDRLRRGAVGKPQDEPAEAKNLEAGESASFAPLPPSPAPSETAVVH